MRGRNARKEFRKKTPLEAPKRSTMPDLSSLFRKNILNAILAHIFNAAGVRTTRTRILLQAFIRVVDKSLEDYELARIAFDEYVNRTSNRTLHPLFRAVGHMENCIGSIYRAVGFAKKLKQEPELALAIPELGILKKGTTRRISILRGAIEHLDKDVLRGTIGEGDLSTLWLDESYLELEGTRIDYSKLGNWLSELQKLTISLAQFKSTTYPTKEQQN